jgi:hypothetical protein
VRKIHGTINEGECWKIRTQKEIKQLQWTEQELKENHVKDRELRLKRIYI